VQYELLIESKTLGLREETAYKIRKLECQTARLDHITRPLQMKADLGLAT
jgi:hypothetical protein